MIYKDNIRIGGVAIPATPPKRDLKSVLNYYKRKVTLVVLKVLEALKLVELQSPTLNVHYAELRKGTDLEQKVADLIKDGETHFDLMSGIGVGYDITFHAIVHLRVMTENYIWRGSRKHLCEVSRQYTCYIGVKTIKCYCNSLRYRPSMFNFWLKPLLPDKDFYGTHEYTIEPLSGRRVKIMLEKERQPIGHLPEHEFPPMQEPFDTLNIDLSNFDIVCEDREFQTGKAPSIIDACQQIIDNAHNLIAQAEKIATSNYGKYLRNACGVHEDLNK